MAVGLAPLLAGCASPYLPSEVYALRFEPGGKCLSSYGLSNDTPVLRADCQYNEYQLYRLVRQPTRDYLITQLRSGKCLDIKDWSRADGAALQLWTCHGGANQRFYFRSKHNRNRIVSSHSQKCVGVESFDQGDGTRIVQDDCDGPNLAGKSIGLMLRDASSPSWGSLANPPGGSSRAIRSAFFFVGDSKGTLGYTYHPYDERHLHWDRSPADREFAVDRMVESGVNVILMSTWGRGSELDATNRWAPTRVTATSRDQLFDLAANRPVLVAPVIETTIPHFVLKNLDSGLCLSVPGGSQESGVRLEAGACLFGKWNFQLRAQKPYWVVEGDGDPADDRFRELRIHESAKCLDVRANGTASGTPVQQWDCTGANNQVFNVEPVGGGDGGAYRFRGKHSGKCLHVNDERKVVIRSCSNSSRQKFWVFHTGGGKDPGLIFEKRYSLPDELGREENNPRTAPYLEDQISALLEHYVTDPADPSWPSAWARIFDRTGEPRHLVYLMFAKSSDSRLRHRDWRWAAQLQQVADAVHARTGIRVGFTLDTAPGPQYGAFWQYYNVTSMASAPALWRHAAVLGIQPYSPESFLGGPEMSDEDRTDAKRGFYQGWLRSGLPVILGMVPYYRVEPDGAPPLDNSPLFGTSSGWLGLQIGLLRDLPVQGVMYTAWNGYEEGYAGVVGRDFHHDPNAPPVSRYTRYNRWAREAFFRASRK